ncbi:hypothetical protein AAG906_006541 [Vitis piasezkii]
MDKGKGKEYIIDLNDEDFDYQYDSIIFNDLTIEDVWKMEFSSERSYRFGVRKDDVKRDKNQNIVSRKWVCNIWIGFNKQMNKWVVKEFMVDHNHPLVEQKYKAQLNAMRGVGMGTSQIMYYMVQQSVDITMLASQKDLYNHVDADRKVHLRDGDAKGALAYLCRKSEMDPSFYNKYNVDEDNHLANLFWADSTSKLDYSCFGDVLAFDTTYRTNAYKKPLVILDGINHHHQTIVFGCALLVDESVSTYTWVLENFLDAMNNKKPLSPSRGYFQTLVIDYVLGIFNAMHSLMSMSKILLIIFLSACSWKAPLKNLNVHGMTCWKCLIFMDISG